MTYRDDAGKPAGFVVEVLNEAARRAGFTLEWLTVGDSQANNDALQRGDLDLITGTDTPERRRLFYVSEPWWSSDLVALTPAASPIRQDSDLNGRRLAVPASTLAPVAQHYPGSTIIQVRSAVEAAEAACTGTADAAIIADVYLRDILLAGSSACRGVNLRTVDTSADVDYVLIARHEASGTVRALKGSLDEITADGTLESLAARHPPVSTPYAERLSELLRFGFQRRIWVISLAASAIVMLLGAVFASRQYRSRLRLRAANERLEQELAALTKAEAALRNSEARFRALFDSAPQTVLAIDRAGVIVFANRKLEEVFGRAREEVIGKNVEILLPERFHVPPGQGRSALAPHAAFSAPASQPGVIGLRGNGTEFPIEVSWGSVETDEGLTLAFITDISERVALLQQLVQSQKLESIGRLAGGVAHDFNNLLTVMTGYSQMVLDELGPDDQLREPINEISQAADRAAALTRQLLLFSRRQMATPKILSLNELARNLEKMLRRLIGEDVELTMALDSRAGFVRADPGHIEQVVMNLAVNARDAMPDGGKLIIETANFHADEDYAGEHTELARGDYVSLIVSDSGIGMTPEVKAHIFEPFYTTKEQGKGTGLGLSTVYGIVKQSGGAVFVYSESGKGTTFKILFPLAETAQPEARTAETPASLSGNETILVAEDEAGIRKFIREVLISHGYTVLEAHSGSEALEMAGKHPGPIHLLVTDLVMPEMSGEDLAERFSKLHSSTPVLRMSGYSDRLWQRDIPADFIEKPFTPSAFLRRVREVLIASRKNSGTES